jgi:hypothetical protein
MKARPGAELGRKGYSTGDILGFHAVALEASQLVEGYGADFTQERPRDNERVQSGRTVEKIDGSVTRAHVPDVDFEPLQDVQFPLQDREINSLYGTAEFGRPPAMGVLRKELEYKGGKGARTHVVEDPHFDRGSASACQACTQQCHRFLQAIWGTPEHAVETEGRP